MSDVLKGKLETLHSTMTKNGIPMVKLSVRTEAGVMTEAAAFRGTAQAIGSHAAIGSEVEFIGSFKEHPRYGMSFTINALSGTLAQKSLSASNKTKADRDEKRRKSLQRKQAGTLLAFLERYSEHASHVPVVEQVGELKFCYSAMFREAVEETGVITIDGKHFPRYVPRGIEWPKDVRI